ncbi:Sensor histidine kinase YpdA [compost metagenome]
MLMNPIHAIRRTTILTKLILTFMLTIIPLYVISLQMNHMGSQNVKDEILGSLDSRLHYYLTSFETEINRILRLQDQYSVDEDIEKLSVIPTSMTDYEVIDMQKRVQNKLLVLRNSSLFVEEASAYFPMMQRTLNSTTYTEAMSDEHVIELQNIARSQKSPLVWWKGQLLINHIFPNPAYSDKKPVYILQSVISQKDILKFLPKATNQKKEEAVILNLQQNWGFSSTSNQAMFEHLAAFLMLPQHMDQPSGKGIMKVNHTSYLVSYEHSQILNTYFLIYLPEVELSGLLHKYRIWFWILSVVSFFIILLFSYWIYRIIHSPLKNLVLAFRKVEAGVLDIHIPHHNFNEFDYLYGQFNSMVSKLNILINEVYESQIRSQRSELKQLQSQINPHFLYNTYFMVRRMADEYDFENIAYLTQHLGDYFLYMTRNAEDEVRFETELKHTISYIEIQSMRFQQRIVTHVSDLPEACKDLMVPKLFLQPIIENAYMHGLKDKMAGGIVELSIQVGEGFVQMNIEDNGESCDEKQIDALNRQLLQTDIEIETTGLINVHRRLQLIFGKEYGVRLSRSILGGLAVTITIQMKEV